MAGRGNRGMGRGGDGIVGTIDSIQSNAMLVGKAVRPATADRGTKEIGTFKGGKYSVIIFPSYPSGEAFLEIALQLFSLGAPIAVEPADALTLYLNIMRLMIPNYDEVFKSVIIECSITPLMATEEQMNQWIAMISEDLEETTAFDDVKLSIGMIHSIIDIYSNFITKKLIPENIDIWYKNRIAAYTNGALCNKENSDLDALRPNLVFTNTIHHSMSRMFPLKKLLFEIIRATSKITSNEFYQTCKVTMVYIHLSELTGFGMVYDWILIRNPILLAWNQLAKHFPHLKAAIRTYQSFGDDAPFCKFLHRSEELTVFQHSRIGIFIEAANLVSRIEGKSSFKNYQGVTKSEISDDMEMQIKTILGLFGGATTRETNAVQNRELTDSPEIDKLRESLMQGIITQYDVALEGPDAPN